MLRVKKISISSLLLSLTLSISCQAQDWEWAKRFGGVRGDGAKDVATDIKGNICLTGFFQNSTIQFDSVTLLNTTSPDTSDIFIAKYDVFGNLIWAKSAGGSSSDIGQSITTDQEGNIFITGYCKGSVAFDNFILTPPSSTYGVPRIFLAKYDALGNFKWANSVISKRYSEGKGIATDHNGNCYITGYSLDSMSFDSIHFIPAGFFITKYDSLGKLLWTKGGNEINNAKGLSVSADENGNIYVAGTLNGYNIKFDTLVLFNTDSFLVSTSDFFLAKFNTNGDALWVRSANGWEMDQALDVSTDAQGNSSVVGYFASDTLNFGSTTLINSRQDDAFIARYDSNGNLLWARAIGDYWDERACGVSVDATGNTFVIGAFGSDTVNVGTYTLTNVNLTSRRPDIFVTKYDNAGTSVWAQSIGGSGFDYGLSIAKSVNDELYITGNYQSPVLFVGSEQLINANDSNSSDVFLAKLAFTSGLPSEKSSPIANTISCFPNPSTNQLTIDVNGQYAEIIRIYNTNSQLVYEFKQAIQNRIDIGQLVPGVYIAEIKIGNHFERIRWVKM